MKRATKNEYSICPRHCVLSKGYCVDAFIPLDKLNQNHYNCSYYKIAYEYKNRGE